jgi:osomolarity two-component system, response regulator SKN7
MTAHIRNLENNYQNVLNEMVYFQRSMAQQDGLMQNLIQYFLQVDSSKVKAGVVPGNEPNGDGGGPSFDGNNSSAETSETNPFVPAQEAQRMMGSYPESDVARASLMQMNEISRRAEVAGMSFDLNGANGASTSASAGVALPVNPTRPNSAVSRLMAATASLLMVDSNNDSQLRPLSRVDALVRREELQRNRPSSSGSSQMRMPEAPFGSTEEFLLPNGNEGNGTIAAPFPTGSLSHEGLQVFTLGHLMPKSGMDDENGNWSFDAGSLGGNDVLPTPAPESGSSSMTAAEFASTSASMDDQFTSAASSESTTQQAASAQKLRVRRSTYVPGWAVPPRVLLVEDDAVSRKLSSKFLQIFGCAIDVAVDGVGAVNKMNLEKYDLVLMVSRYCSSVHVQSLTGSNRILLCQNSTESPLLL